MQLQLDSGGAAYISRCEGMKIYGAVSQSPHIHKWVKVKVIHLYINPRLNVQHHIITSAASAHGWPRLMEVVLKIRSTPIDSIYVCMCVTFVYAYTAQKMSVLLMRSIHCANDTGQWNEWQILNLCWLMQTYDRIFKPLYTSFFLYTYTYVYIIQMKRTGLLRKGIYILALYCLCEGRMLPFLPIYIFFHHHGTYFDLN